MLIYWGGYRTWEDLPVPGMLRYQIERSHDPTGVPARRRNGLTRGEIAMRFWQLFAAWVAVSFTAGAAHAAEFGRHGFVDSDGVKIHYCPGPPIFALSDPQRNSLRHSMLS